MLIGEVLGMLLFGLLIDRFGRRVGVIATTVFLVFVCLLLHVSILQINSGLGHCPRYCFSWHIFNRYVLDDDHLQRYSWCWCWW